ncbi:helix-turn-helix domain-containing protein [Jiulongibacter sp. NS-SX5]|uniref:helix-turn-helix domain-containing protein n=1 Tax=Jiulongibacter sp. NS-SX5 TaxID=3463854 RepID=UPI004057FA5F
MNELTLILQTLRQEIEILRAYLSAFQTSAVKQLQANWLDGQDVMQTLHISKRTLQYLRDSGTLPYSRINGKFYYKADDIRALLDTNYVNKGGDHA